MLLSWSLLTVVLLVGMLLWFPCMVVCVATVVVVVVVFVGSTLVDIVRVLAVVDCFGMLYGVLLLVSLHILMLQICSSILHRV